jgi:putative ATP-dependent endonuclease of the OLD family
MKLSTIQLQGFRPFNEQIDIDFERLTMLIGNNDSGKSSILDILDIALDLKKRPDDKDFFTSTIVDDANEIIATLHFDIDPEEEDAQVYASDNKIIFKTTYTRDNVTREYLAKVPQNEELRCQFQQLAAQEQKEIIETFDPAALETTSNSDNRTAWFNQFIQTVELVEDWKDIPPDFMKLLPKVQRYSAMDYETPEKLIDRTVRQIFESVLYEKVEDDDDGERELRTALKEIEEEAEQKINDEVADLKAYIQKYAPSVQNISYEPQIDFVRGFQSGVFKVDEGRGEHYLNKSGDGTKRKILMATTDWDREVNLEIQAEGGSLPDIIRAYDEPDTNLDYHAQRHLYKSILEISSGENSNIQAIISTHSPRMIDRAPAKSIRMITAKDGRMVVDKLQTGDDEEVELFLSEVARDLGITNSLMFYENCFIFVEGDTEENALPLFYRKLYGHSMLEDGINIINVKGKSAFKEFLRLISHNRQELAVFLMDQDCADTDDDKMTEQILRENGFSEKFCQDRIMLVGRQEFEDLFEPGIYTRVYNSKWPKDEGEWIADEFAALDPEKKYSSELRKIMYENCGECGDKWSKPELGYAFGAMCTEDEIPQEIKDLFTLARQIAKIVEEGTSS